MVFDTTDDPCSNQLSEWESKMLIFLFYSFLPHVSWHSPMIWAQTATLFFLSSKYHYRLTDFFFSMLSSVTISFPHDGPQCERCSVLCPLSRPHCLTTSFLAFWHNHTGSPWAFPTLGLELATSPRRPGSQEPRSRLQVCSQVWGIFASRPFQ